MLDFLVSDWIDLDIPADGHYAAIADVHGRADLFAAMLEDLDRTLPPDASLVLLGDLIDRGFHSIKVIDMAMAGIGGRRTIPLSGNHESMLVHAIDMRDEELAGYAMHMWFHNGGEDVLDELDCDAEAFAIRKALGYDRVAFLESMLPHHLAGGVLFAHAGVHPRKPLAEQLAQPVRDFATYFNAGGNESLSMRWIRQSWVGHMEPIEGNLLVVYGHTIQEKGSPLLTPCQAGIDLGAYESGILCCAEVDYGRIRFRFVGEKLSPLLQDPRSYVLGVLPDLED